MLLPHNEHNISHVETYNQMLDLIRDRLENAEAHAIPSILKLMQQAKDEAIHIGEIGIEDAEQISRYLKCDIYEATEYLMEYSRDFSSWFLLDIEIIEQKILELFLSVADKTRIELEQFSRPSTKYR